MAARDEFPEHDRVLRDWFAAHGWPVTESFDHVDADIRAWRHSGTEWRCTLHVAKEVLERNDAASLVMLLDQRFTADTLRQLPNARQFSVTGGRSWCYATSKTRKADERAAIFRYLPGARKLCLEGSTMIRPALFVLAALSIGLRPGLASAQAKRYALESTTGLRAHNVVTASVTFKGKRGVRVTGLPDVAGQLEAELLARIEGLQFSSGVIEAEIAGAPAPGAGAGARGFVGIAFRLQDDNKTYDAFYLRPTNGRADDQERRNHATQYISHPEWTWSRLRRETPSKYESYVDLESDTWTKIRIEVRGAQARLFVHDQQQPVLIVNDVKSGASSTGAVALWIGPGTVAHFRNLVVTATDGR